MMTQWWRAATAVRMERKVTEMTRMTRTTRMTKMKQKSLSAARRYDYAWWSVSVCWCFGVIFARTCRSNERAASSLNKALSRL